MNHDDRAFGIVHDGQCRGTEQHRLESAAAAQSDHQQIRLATRCNQHLRRVTLRHVASD